MKRILAIILGIGAILICILIGVFFYASHSLKKNAEISINAYLKDFQDKNPDFHYEPFRCTGFKNITCKSEKIALENVIMLENVKFWLEGLRDKEKLNVFLESPKITLSQTDKTFIDVFLSTVAPNVEISKFIIPESFKCKLENQSTQNMQIHNDLECKFIATNAEYIIKTKTTQDYQATQAEGIKTMLIAMYNDYKANPQEFQKNFKISLSNMQYEIIPKNLSDTIFDTIKAQNQNLTKEEYDRSIQAAKNLATYIYGLSANTQDLDYKQKFAHSFDGLARMLSGKNNGITYNFTQKDKFVPLSDVQSNILNLFDTTNMEFVFVEKDKNDQ